MKEIATFSRPKFLLEALLRMPVGLFFLGIAGIVVPLMVRDEVRKGQGSWGALAFGLFPLLLGFLFLAAGIRRLTAAFRKNLWIKAGPEGVSFRLPYGLSARTLLLLYPIQERTIPWSDVSEAFVLQYKVNGLPFGQAFILRTRQGRYNFGGYFKEPAPAIVEALRSTR